MYPQHRIGSPLHLSGEGLTRGVATVLAATVGCFILQKLVLATWFSHSGLELFGLTQGTFMQGRLWQLVSYAFLHGDLWHLLLNMLMLYFFGRELESLLGQRTFLWLYFGCAAAAGVGWLIISASANDVCIGASGAVLGLLGAFAALFPHREITLLIMFVLPVTMTARTMAVLCGVITLLMLVVDEGNVAHSAHLAGGIAGFLYARYRLAGIAGASRIRGRRHERRAPWLHLVDDQESEVEPWKREEDAEDPHDPEEVDRILEKISNAGVGSLTRRERKILEDASRRL